MAFDFTTAMIQATVAVAGAPGGATTVGTGVLVSDPTPDGTPRVVLVTARHVLQDIAGPQAYLALHLPTAAGDWRKEWRAEAILDGAARPLWVRNPSYDVAVLPVSVPPEAAQAAIPVSWFADAASFARGGLEPGDAMGVLGYPAGLASDQRGFAILRIGRLASYPMTPQTEGSFLVDFPVTSGNSGGPVFTSRRTGRGPQLVGAQGPQPDEFVAGIVAQQIVPGGQSINLGLVVHSLYVRQTLELLDRSASYSTRMQSLAPSTSAAADP